MSKENEEKMQESSALLAEHLAKVEASAELFLAALKGFRRDLTLSGKNDSRFIKTDFTGTITTMQVPHLTGGRSFADLENMLGLAKDALYGTVALKKPHENAEQKEQGKLLEEIEITHKNLLDVSETAYRLYECIQSAGFEFDVFNTKNIEVGFTEANIAFDRDALNLSMVTARALSECAVRIDIDLMEGKERLVTGEHKPKV